MARGVLEIDAVCDCGHRESDHINGRINQQCTREFCHCSGFTPTRTFALVYGKLEKVAWVQK